MGTQMLKRDFFIQALQHNADFKRDWVMSVFGILEEDEDAWRKDPYPYRPFKTGNGYSFLLPIDDNQDEFTIEEITDSFHTPLVPLAGWLEPITVEKGELVNQVSDTPIKTTYGNTFVNHLIFCVPLGREVPFITGEINIGKISNQIFEKVVDDPDDTPSASLSNIPIDVESHEKPSPDGVVYVREFLKFGEFATSLVSYNSIAVNSVTPKSLVGHPDARKRREELKEKYKDRLTDPVIISKIGDELEKLDREWLKGDPADKFYQTNEGKYYGKVRKRLFYMFGGEAPFSDGTVMQFIERSLEEGIVPDDLPAVINSLRHGTHSRGSQTQLGGEATKTIYRMVGTSRIEEEDCGSRIGIPFQVTNWNHYLFTGFYEIRGKKDHLLTEEEIASREGETIVIRTPTTCKTEGRNLCSRCVGVALAELPDGIAATSAQTSGVFLTSFLKAFHGKELKTKQLNIDHWLR